MGDCDLHDGAGISGDNRDLEIISPMGILWEVNGQKKRPSTLHGK